MSLGLELDSIPGSPFGGTDDRNPVHPVTWLEGLTTPYLVRHTIRYEEVNKQPAAERTGR